ncbi:MAG: S8 family serine peptidase [Candidatus Kapaibacterium sp.]
MKKTNRFYGVSFLQCIIALILLLTIFSGNVQAQNHSDNTLIIKFISGSQTLNLAREICPEDIGSVYKPGSSNNDKSKAFDKFMTENFISSIKAVKPDATLKTLPGGIERIFIVSVSDKTLLKKAYDKISKNGEIEYTEYDFIGSGSGKPYGENSFTPNDPSFGNQWGLRNTGQVIGGITGTSGGDVNALNAWDVTTGSNLIVSVLDTGMPLSHPEFSGRLLQGYDYVNNDNDPTDDQGHGTNVASIMAAKGNNGSLVAGVNWNCRIIPVKILNSSNLGQYSWWISGITYAVDNGAKVLNMSVGGSSYSQSLSDAVTYAYTNGRIVVVCMMNNNNNIPYYPAAFFNNVIAIGAINNRMERAVPFCWGGGSSYGSHISFTAPGEMILGLSYNNPSTTNYWCGTSQATPIAAGVVSLLLSKNSTLSFSQIYNALKVSARDQVGPPAEDTPGFDNYFGWGLIDARGALNQVVGITNISEVIPDNFSLSQNYPNPFNPNTVISFQLTGNSNVVIKVYDVQGREVQTLVNERMNAGTYEVDFEGRELNSGVYIYQMRAGNFSEAKRMLLVK